MTMPAESSRATEDERVDVWSEGCLGGCALAFGLPFVLSGTFIVLIGIGVIQVQSAKFHAPRFIVASIGAAFLLAGLWVFKFAGSKCLHAWCRHRRLQQCRTVWDRDFAWNPRGIRGRRETGVGGALAMVTLGALLLAPFNWWVFFNGGPPALMLVVAVFDVTLIGFILRCKDALLTQWRFRMPFLRFDEYPFLLGQQLNCGLVLHRPRRVTEPMICTLRCVDRWSGREKDEEGKWQVMEYEEKQYEAHEQLEPRPDVVGAIGMSVALPLDQPSTRRAAEKQTCWELEVRYQVGEHFDRVFFDVPVYAPVPREDM